MNERISSLDLTLFDPIPSQTTNEDKTSLLSIQSAVGSQLPEYTYLEIGSYHGGSIQPYLADSKCKRIYSIDKRPKKQYDERGTAFAYPEGFTQVMMQKLSASYPEQVGKIKTFEMDATEVPVQDIPEQPDLFFIDGEHTDPAVVSDFNFVYSLIRGPAIVAFHDAHIVFKGLTDITAGLQKSGVQFQAYCLPHCIFVIELNGFNLHQHPSIQKLLINNYQAYLPSLYSMRKYREYCTHLPVKIYIRIYKTFYRLYSNTLRPLKQKLLLKK